MVSSRAGTSAIDRDPHSNIAGEVATTTARASPTGKETRGLVAHTSATGSSAQLARLSASAAFVGSIPSNPRAAMHTGKPDGYEGQGT